MQGVGLLEVLEVRGLGRKPHVLVGLKQSRVDMLVSQSGCLGKIAHSARNVVEALIQHLPTLAVCIHVRGFQVNRRREVSNSRHNSSVVIVLGSMQAPTLVVGIHRPGVQLDDCAIVGSCLTYVTQALVYRGPLGVHLLSHRGDAKSLHTILKSIRVVATLGQQSAASDVRTGATGITPQGSRVVFQCPLRVVGVVCEEVATLHISLCRLAVQLDSRSVAFSGLRIVVL
mmetsp:Transcript_96384/g.166142  ORF Transcript_96384/g.166142 Transcript_96384/m.166142 type:complete len:229 (-) Transcript_96384:3566-4252(-)